MFACKKICANWGYDWQAIYVDDANIVCPGLYVDGEYVASAWAENEEVKVDMDSVWKEHFVEAKIQDDIDKVNETLKKSKAPKTKGKGGKAGGKSGGKKNGKAKDAGKDGLGK